MALQSELFRDDTSLQACLVKDSAHIVKGARGQHVAKIQTALGIIEGALIDSDELSASFYGPATSPDALRANATRLSVRHESHRAEIRDIPE